MHRVGKYSILSFVCASSFLPGAVHAQTIKDKIEIAQNVVAVAMVPLLGLALLTFFYGVVKYLVVSQKNPDAATKGRSVLLWGIIVLFIVVAMWGFVRILRTTFGLV